MKLFFSLFIIFSFFLNVKSQDINPYQFVDSKNTPDGRMVYFKIKSADGKINKSLIENAFSSENNIVFYKIHSNNFCQLELNNNINELRIKSLLSELSYDFDYSTVRVNETLLEKYNNSVKTNDNQKKSSNEPQFIDTGNPEYDKQVYENKKQEWIKNYPDEVAKFTNRKKEDIHIENKIDNNFPKYVNTGNASKDDANYEKAKSNYLNSINK